METEKDDIIECTVEDMGVYGEGITHVGGQTVFIPGAIKGEKVKAKIVLAKADFAHAVLVKILEESPYRAEPPCPYFKQCGGCSLQHVGYSGQLELKREIVRNAFAKYAKVAVDVKPTVESDNEYRYRNKLSMPVRFDSKRDTVGGLFMKRSHRVIETKDCLLQKEPTFVAAKNALSFAVREGLKGYDETSGGGDLRHITVRKIEGKLSLTFVLNGEREKFCSRLIDAANHDGRDTFSLFVNINTTRNNVILGKETRLIYGTDETDISVGKVRVHPAAFFQVNDGVRDKLYAAVCERVKNNSVIDAYSGAGIMSAMLAKSAKHVIGIEISRAAVDSAQALKKSSDIKNLDFVCGDCAEELGGAVKISKNYSDKIDVVLDPPKSGCDRAVIDVLNFEKNVEKIVYVSCNPATCARDCALLTNFDITEAVPFDMFPQTASVETLVTLFHKKPDSHIEVTVDFENGKIKKDDIIERAEKEKPKEKPTYKMIQKWVEENYGFKVHTAYIAEIKRDLGLPMYDAPNAVEELKRPRAHPTQKMVDAIKDALKHFEII